VWCAARKACRPAGVPQYGIVWSKTSRISSTEDFGADWIALPARDDGDITADAAAWRNAGGTHISLVTMGLGLDSARSHIDYLESVAGALSLS
jgi:hypothetical protein